MILNGNRRSTDTPGFLFRGPAFDEVTADMIAESGRRRDLNRAARGDFDWRIDDVLFPITFAGGDIARECVARQGRDRDVVWPADAAFEHAATTRADVSGEALSPDLARARMGA